MDPNFYSNWLKSHRKQNREILKWLLDKNTSSNDHDTDSNSNDSDGDTDSFQTINNVVFKSKDFKLQLRQDFHKRQKIFKLQDFLYTVKIIPLTKDYESTNLIDLLPFLQEGFTFIVKQLTKFFNSKEHRIAYLTLFQTPMVSCKIKCSIEWQKV